MSLVFALVHSPLVGATTWRAGAERLRLHGERAVVPDLTAALASGPPYIARQAVAVAEAVGEEPVILVGHSGAGPLLPAFGDRLAQVAGYVFVDAGLPTPGLSWMDTAPSSLVGQLEGMADDGWLPPWALWWGEDALASLLPDPELRKEFAENCPPLPMAMFGERRPPVTDWPDAPCAYLRLSDSYQSEYEQAQALGWGSAELPGHHLAMVTDPDAVADSIRDLARQFG